MRALLLLLVTSSLAYAQPSAKLKPEAQVHLDAFLKAYEQKDWDTALRELDLAYAADPNPALLYSKAQTLRLANRCADAIVVYKKYLERDLTAEQQAAARTNIQTCEKLIASQPEPKPEPKIEPNPEPKVEATPELRPIEVKPEPETPPGPRPWYKDPIGGALVGGGVVGIAVGVVFRLKGSSSEDAAGDASTRDEFLQKLDDAESQKRIGAIALGVGGALVVGGIVVYVLHKEPARDRVTLTTDGQSLFVAGSF